MNFETIPSKYEYKNIFTVRMRCEQGGNKHEMRQHVTGILSDLSSPDACLVYTVEYKNILTWDTNVPTDGSISFFA